ncbi:LUD domain-containing protein [Micromonospora sp. WMMD882]|uniref:LutC/YkgG family protein n=1 Tax=Micromonospora sp. WMMD882 TaxID=3015151 RepID=UPI00248CD57A|nr:LUD domain-containing protein [Micromonospora sp. WMMD882]WBB80478.1 LUD domain-containing protein [Micromonospora sp. WMMD882]
MTARAEILARLRAARSASPVAVPRDYDRRGELGDPVAVFADRVGDYRAGVYRTDPAGLAEVLGGLLPAGRVVVVPADVPSEWVAGCRGRILRDGLPVPLTVAELAADGVSVLTGCAVAVAPTGTLVLDGGPGQGRRALTLLPDHHVCVVAGGQIVGGLAPALARLPDPTRPLTFVSGPSATSDIELDRVEGVHGPRRLDVVIVGPRRGGAADPDCVP